jgi:ABC-type nitrate/sulfonate/bicarbonate transport system permease component
MRRAAVSRDILVWRLLLLAGVLFLWELGVRQGWIDRFFVSLPTHEGVMSVLRTFEAVGQIPNATTMDPGGLIDTGFVMKALERK